MVKVRFIPGDDSESSSCSKAVILLVEVVCGWVKHCCCPEKNSSSWMQLLAFAGLPPDCRHNSHRERLCFQWKCLPHFSLLLRRDAAQHIGKDHLSPFDSEVLFSKLFLKSVKAAYGDIKGSLLVYCLKPQCVFYCSRCWRLFTVFGPHVNGKPKGRSLRSEIFG